MADVNALGETPLLSLLRSGSLKGVKELLSDVNQGDLLGETPLMEAACMGDKDLCLLLLQPLAFEVLVFQALRSRADVSQRNVQGQRAEDLAKAAHFVDIAEPRGDPSSELSIDPQLTGVADSLCRGC